MFHRRGEFGSCSSLTAEVGLQLLMAIVRTKSQTRMSRNELLLLIKIIHSYGPISIIDSADLKALYLVAYLDRARTLGPHLIITIGKGASTKQSVPRNVPVHFTPIVRNMLGLSNGNAAAVKLLRNVLMARALFTSARYTSTR